MISKGEIKMVKIHEQLRETVAGQIEELNEMEVGSEQWKIAAEGIVKLVDRIVEIEKTDVELDEKIRNREQNHELKSKELKQDNKHRWIQTAVQTLGIAAPIAATIWGAKVSLEFEKSGTFTTLFGRSTFTNLFKRK